MTRLFSEMRLFVFSQMCAAIALVCLTGFTAVFSFPAAAQTVAESVPDSPGALEEEHDIFNGNPLESDLPIVVELFSSQACVFCPHADRFFADIVKQPNIIGLNCHVDYFDVKTGSLSQPFCTERQTWYAETVGSGPVYTPQVIVQGMFDVVGYRFDNILERLRSAAAIDRFPVTISPRNGKENSYRADSALPAAKDPDGLRIWVALFDKPHDITVASGRNAGQHMTYMNIVSDIQDLGPWTGGSVNFKVVPVKKQAGFIFAIQDRENGRILAANSYLFPSGSKDMNEIPAP